MGLLGKLGEAASNGLDNLGNSIKQGAYDHTIGAAKQGISNAIEEGKSRAQSFVDQKKEEALQKLNEYKDTAVAKAKSRVTTAVNNVKSEAMGAYKDVRNSVSGIAKGIKNRDLMAVTSSASKLSGSVASVRSGSLISAALKPPASEDEEQFDDFEYYENSDVTAEALLNDLDCMTDEEKDLVGSCETTSFANAETENPPIEHYEAELNKLCSQRKEGGNSSSVDDYLRVKIFDVQKEYIGARIMKFPKNLDESEFRQKYMALLKEVSAKPDFSSALAYLSNEVVNLQLAEADYRIKSTIGLKNKREKLLDEGGYDAADKKSPKSFSKAMEKIISKNASEFEARSPADSKYKVSNLPEYEYTKKCIEIMNECKKEDFFEGFNMDALIAPQAKRMEGLQIIEDAKKKANGNQVMFYEYLFKDFTEKGNEYEIAARKAAGRLGQEIVSSIVKTNAPATPSENKECWQIEFDAILEEIGNGHHTSEIGLLYFKTEKAFLSKMEQNNFQNVAQLKKDLDKTVTKQLSMLVMNTAEDLPVKTINPIKLVKNVIQYIQSTISNSEAWKKINASYPEYVSAVKKLTWKDNLSTTFHAAVSALKILLIIVFIIYACFAVNTVEPVIGKESGSMVRMLDNEAKAPENKKNVKERFAAFAENPEVIPADQVKISGPLSNLLTVTGDGMALTPDAENGALTIQFSVKATGDVQSYINKQLNAPYKKSNIKTVFIDEYNGPEGHDDDELGTALTIGALLFNVDGYESSMLGKDVVEILKNVASLKKGETSDIKLIFGKYTDGAYRAPIQESLSVLEMKDFTVCFNYAYKVTKLDADDKETDEHVYVKIE